MKKIFYIAIILSFFQPGCQDDPCLKKSGDRIEEIRDLDNVYKISLHDNLDLDIYQTTGESRIVVKGGENVVPFIKTEVENGRLTISNDNKCYFLRSFDKDIKLVLYVDSLKRIDYDGSGNIYMASEFVEERFEFNSNQGSGSVDLLLWCQELSLQNEAAISDIKFSGYADFAEIYNDGSGWMNVCQERDGRINHAQVYNSSSGDVLVDVGCRLDYTIAGLGNIQVGHENQNACDTLSINSNDNTGKGRLIQLK